MKSGIGLCAYIMKTFSCLLDLYFVYVVETIVTLKWDSHHKYMSPVHAFFYLYFSCIHEALFHSHPCMHVIESSNEESTPPISTRSPNKRWCHVDRAMCHAHGDSCYWSELEWLGSRRTYCEWSDSTHLSSTHVKTITNPSKHHITSYRQLVCKLQ